MPNVALTREVSTSIARCELTHVARTPIDVDLARAQHAAYERALADAGYRVERLPAADDLPDSVFVEDIALVFDEVALVARPGAPSRRAEIPAVADALARYRRVVAIQAPGTLDGGDVVVVGTKVFVGVSSRTNRDGVAQLGRHLAPFGYTTNEVTVTGCLHLKSAVTAAGEQTIVVNPRWIPVDSFAGFERIEIDPTEPMAANVVRLADRLIVAAAFPRTNARLAACGYHVVAVDASELAKAEGAVTCCSVLINR